jgi:uncharacterized protein (TIGR03437 family)
MRKTLLLIFASLPAFALSGGAPVNLNNVPGRTAAPGDGVCRDCHTTFPLNSAGGSIRIETGTYKPGMPQTVKVTIAHPDSSRWGFQITARWARDLAQQAGRFTSQSGDVQEQVNGRYATHTSAGTLTGANGTKTFELLWTPPEGAADGDIVLYAAGNAANNSTNNQGDRIYTTTARVQPEITCAFTERPVVTRVVNAASGNPGGSANALISIFGSNFTALGSTRTAHAGYIRDNKFPTELDCVAVEVAGQRVPILYAQADQINVQAPTFTSTGELPVRVLLNAGRPNELASVPGTVRAVNFSPAFFTFNGRSVAAVSNDGPTIADPVLAIPGGRPARRGEIVQLYATGLGATQTAVAPGTIAGNDPNRLNGRVSITIGGTTLTDADILYAGLAPGNISGLYQINVRIPATAANGDLPIAMAISGEQSIAGTTIPVLTP